MRISQNQVLIESLRVRLMLTVSHGALMARYTLNGW